MQVAPEEIPAVAKLVDGLCGVVLDETKGYLIDSRLGSIAEAAGCANFTEFCRKAGFDHALQNQIIDAITTQETLFFRDTSPFEVLQHKAIPELIDAKVHTAFPKRLRIWSSAASTGQEAYSIAMTLWEMIPDVLSWDINILGTDISDAAVKQASLGIYAKHEVQRGMKPLLLRKYFTEEPRGWRINDEVRSLVAFRHHNLLKPFTGLGPFDIIFCRNVAIYFEDDVKRDLFNRLADRLSTDGYLFVGSSESLTSIGPRFAPQHHCRSVFYQPNKQSAMAMA